MMGMRNGHNVLTLHDQNLLCVCSVLTAIYSQKEESTDDCRVLDKKDGYGTWGWGSV